MTNLFLCNLDLCQFQNKKKWIPDKTWKLAKTDTDMRTTKHTIKLQLLFFWKLNVNNIWWFVILSKSYIFDLSITNYKNWPGSTYVGMSAFGDKWLQCLLICRPSVFSRSNSEHFCTTNWRGCLMWVTYTNSCLTAKVESKLILIPGMTNSNAKVESKLILIPGMTNSNITVFLAKYTGD